MENMTEIKIIKQEKSTKIKQQNECYLCSKTFSSKTNLNRHIATLHAMAPRRHNCPICYKSFTRSDTRNTHLKALHDMDIKDFDDSEKTNWKLQALKPAKHIPTFEARTSTSTRRKHTHEFDDTLKIYSEPIELSNCTLQDVPSHLRPPSRPPTPTLDEPLPPVAYRAKREETTTHIWVKRPFIIPKKRFCTIEVMRPLKIAKFFQRKRETNAPKDYKALLQNTKSADEKILRFESEANQVTMITQCTTHQEGSQPICQSDNEQLNEVHPPIHDPKLLENDLYLSDDSEDGSDFDFKTSLSNIKNQLDGLNKQLATWSNKGK